MFGGNFRITCIDSEEENIASALKNEYFDCVILDNTLNAISGLQQTVLRSKTDAMRSERT